MDSRTVNKILSDSGQGLVCCILFLVLSSLTCPICGQRPPTQFSQQPVPGQPVVQGNTAFITCQVDNLASTPLQYEWYKNGVKVDTDSTTQGTLRLSQVSATHAGNYQCLVKNRYGALLSRKAKLQVVTMGDFVGHETVTTLSVDQGKAIVLRVPEIESVPEATIRWSVNGTDVADNELINYITYKKDLVVLQADVNKPRTNVQVEGYNMFTGTNSRKNFILIVRNIGSSSSTIGPSIVLGPEAQTSAVHGQSNAAHIECVVNARPLTSVTIKWYRIDGSTETEITQSTSGYVLSPVIGDTEPKLYVNRRLSIVTPTSSMSGVYKCVASMPGKTSVSATTNLTVSVLPSISNQLTEVSQNVGQTVQIPCQVGGSPQPTVTWYRNGVMVTATMSGYSQLANNSLRAVLTSSDQAGIYQCFAKNTAGEISSPATWLKVFSSIPVFTVRPIDTSAIVNKIARLTCTATGAPSPVISWKRETSSGWTTVVNGDRYQVTADSLTILSAEKRDSGKYACHASNSQGTVNATANVRVLLPTKITMPPQNKKVVRSSTAFLACGYTHDPTVQVTVTWYKNSVPVSLIPNRVFVTSEGYLRILTVGLSYNGRYTCKLTSEAGNDTASATLTVIEVPYTPHSVVAAINQVDLKAVDVSWRRDSDGGSPITHFIIQKRILPTGGQLDPNEGWQVAAANVPAGANDNADTINKHTITGLLPARNYQFRVSAVNEVGEGRYSNPSPNITIPQQKPSAPPIIQQRTATSSTTIDITWVPPPEAQWNGPLLGYKIKYRVDRYSNENIEDYPNTVSARYTLSGLDPYTDYVIGVAAYNIKGVGVYSDSVTVRTEEGIPSDPATLSNVTAVSSTSVYLQFYPPQRHVINSDSLGFRLIAQLPNVVGPEKVTTMPPDVGHVLGVQSGEISGLRKYTEYRVSIVCFTGKGDGPVSEVRTVKTLEDVPDAVSDLKVTEVKHSSVVVQWRPPANRNGELLGYTLEYIEKGANNGSREVRVLFPNIQHHEITGLKPQTQYMIEVYARTKVGSGPSQMVEITSGVTPVPPYAPTALAVTNRLKRSVVLQFRPGFNGHTSISMWLVEAQVEGTTEWLSIYNESAPDAESLTVRNLRPYTGYRLRIKAQNVAGISPASQQSQIFQTLMDFPDVAPTNLILRALNETAIIVRWTPLKSSEWNGTPLGYIIQYKPLSGTDYNEVTVSDKNANTYNLIQLEEWMEYTIRMLSINELGRTGPGQEKSERTWESVPSSGPRMISVTAVNSTAIEVKWNEVPPLDQNGHIKGYKILYQAVHETGWQTVTVQGGEVRSAEVTHLRKYVKYHFKMQAFTNIGDGKITPESLSVKTMEDTPGPPSSIYFPTVTSTTASIVWSPPREPNGIISGYKVTYRDKVGGDEVVDNSLGSGQRVYDVAGLQAEKTYVFSVTAKTRLGWGEPKELEVMTYLNRRPPGAPENVLVSESSISARSVKISWVPGNHWYSPIRNYTIQYRRNIRQVKRAVTGSWVTAEVIEFTAGVTSYVVTGLIPNSQYQFRMSATNDKGTSPFSALSSAIVTKQAAPSSAPVNLKVTPYTQTSVNITWQPPPRDSWNGPLSSYRIQYKEENFTIFQEKYVTFPNTSESLKGLTKGVNYEVKVNAQNSQGHGPSSRTVVVFVGEAVPTAAPMNVKLEGINSTKVQLSWEPPPPSGQNGKILGYKIYYWVTSYGRENAVLEMAEATDRTYSLSGLHIYTPYTAVILAFNLAGDGPNCTQVSARTREGAPGPPGQLSFRDVTMTSLRVRWTKPAQANGNITKYYVLYYQQQEVDGETKNVEVEVTGSKLYYVATDLKEYVKYGFKVSASTVVDRGPYTEGNITTGPQEGSPEPPINPSFIPGDNSITLQWKVGSPGASPIKGYVIQAKAQDSSTWTTITQTSTAEPSVVISYLNLRPNTYYTFRVIAFNSQGISYPSVAKEQIRTPDYSTQAEFYHQWWFLVIVALAGTILIISTIALLCFVSRKASKEALRLKSNEEVGNTVDEGGFNTFELRRSQRAQSSRGASSSRHNGTIPVRHPARPSSLTYSEDEKPPKYPSSSSADDDEKPSDLDSPSESEVSETEPESEDETKNTTTSFTNHYVNAPVSQTWKSQNSANAYAYTDSEQESQYAVSLNGHVIMNNTAGSRAPLPGFSSFV